MEKTYKIPEGSESIVDNMVAVGVERFLAQQMKEVPVQEKPEYQTAVDSFRTDNKMELRFTKVEEVLVEEKLDDTDTSINKILGL
jgi:hypothetical protein